LSLECGVFLDKNEMQIKVLTLLKAAHVNNIKNNTKLTNSTYRKILKFHFCSYLTNKDFQHT